VNKKKHILYSGADVTLKQYTILDLVPVPFIKDEVDKDTLKSIRNHQGAGRNYNRQAFTLGQRIIRLFLKNITDKMMEGDRILLPYGKVMYIGVIPDNPDRIAKWRKKKLLNLRTNGKRYGIKLLGMEHNSYFRMPQRRRTELYNRIVAGQTFLN
jgi:hypothetical protein